MCKKLLRVMVLGDFSAKTGVASITFFRQMVIPSLVKGIF
jgi:hypothetical protein